MKRKLMVGVGAILAASITVVSSMAFEKEVKALEALPTEVYTESVKEMAKSGNKMFQFAGANSFDELVESGVISQATADGMQTFMESNVPQREEIILEDETEEKKEREFVDIYSKMVNAGILTQEEADAINAFYLDQAEAYQKADIEERSARYVSEGILTQEEANAVKDYLLNQPMMGVGHMATTAATVSVDAGIDVEIGDFVITEDEGSISGKSDFHGFGTNEMVEQGIITAEQSEAMMASDRKVAENQRIAELTKALDTLVAEGTLTQEKADKTLEYLNNQERSVEILKETVESTDLEEQTGKGKTRDGDITIRAFDLYEGLVTDGILTQEELDAFRLALPEHRMSFSHMSTVVADEV